MISNTYYYPFAFPIMPPKRTVLILSAIFTTIIIAISAFFYFYTTNLKEQLATCQLVKDASNSKFLLGQNICYCPSCESANSLKQIDQNCELYCVGYPPKCEVAR